MGKKSEKKKHRKWSSSGEDNDKVSKEQDATRKCKNARRMHDVDDQKSCAKLENCTFSGPSFSRSVNNMYAFENRNHRKMGKKSKKKKQRKLSSSSSDDDEKVSKEQDTTRKRKHAKRMRDLDDQKSCAKLENRASPFKDVSQSIRQIKTPVYKLTKTTDWKPSSKEEERSKTNRPSVTFHGVNCSSKAQNDTSGKHYNVGGSNTDRRQSSEPLNTYNAVTEVSKGCLDEKSPKRSPSKLKKQQRSSSWSSDKQKQQPQNVLNMKCRAVEPPRSDQDSRTLNTREPSKTSKDFLWQNVAESLKNGCQRHEKNDLKAKRDLCKEASTSSSFTKLSFSVAKQYNLVCSSNALRNVSSISGHVNPVPHKTAKLSSAPHDICSIASPVPPDVKIPKRVQSRPVERTSENEDAISANRYLKYETEISNSENSLNDSKQESVMRVQGRLGATPAVSSKAPDKGSSFPWHLPVVLTPREETEPSYDKMQVVDELHLARSEKRLEVDIMQSYGELTCMEIDVPEEKAAGTHFKQPAQLDLILVLDTNILLSHLDYVKKITTHGHRVMGCPLVLIPWVVLQELDSLKRGRGLSGSVAHLAAPAISYINNCLKSREPRFWGQSMQQAADSSNELNAENNDDRVLQCCLQYQSLYPGCALILCTNDKNLCSKAILSGVTALSKSDLETEAGRSSCDFRPLQDIRTSVLSPIGPKLTSSMLTTNYASVQPHSQEKTCLSLGLLEKDYQQVSKRVDEETTGPSRCVSELEDCLREVLSDVLEVEMKAAYEDLWLEIAYIKPPWTLLDVLHCFKKHWIAVFGLIVPRRKLQTVLNLIKFFTSGETVDHSKNLSILKEAKELVRAFCKSSSYTSSAVFKMDNMFNKLQPGQATSSHNQSESSACEVAMTDDFNEDQLMSPQMSHEDMWALFENIWKNVLQRSMEVFSTLAFDPHTMQSTPAGEGLSPPQDAMACLHKMSSTVSQLLVAFNSFFSSRPGSEGVQTLLNIIRSIEIVNVDSRLTAKDLLDCFSQQEYREKLRVGGNQLMELKVALDRCVDTMGSNISFTT